MSLKEELVSNAEVSPDGSFALAGFEPAPYRVNVGGVHSPMFVKSIRFNGHDTSQETIDLAYSPNPSLEIVVSDKSSTITGAVHDSTGAAVPSAVVAVQGRGVAAPRRTAFTDENGRFSVTGLPAGEYLVGAMDTGSAFLVMPPDLMQRLATAIKVEEGITATADLQLLDFAALR